MVENDERAFMSKREQFLAFVWVARSREDFTGKSNDTTLIMHIASQIPEEQNSRQCDERGQSLPGVLQRRLQTAAPLDAGATAGIGSDGHCAESLRTAQSRG